MGDGEVLPDMQFLLKLYLKQGQEATLADPIKNSDYNPFKSDFVMPLYTPKEEEFDLSRDYQAGRKKRSYDFLDELRGNYQ
ncbi:MAG: hypothetical protein AABW48_02340 [Nanoarchaeota archaeon]